MPCALEIRHPASIFHARTAVVGPGRKSWFRFRLSVSPSLKTQLSGPPDTGYCAAACTASTLQLTRTVSLSTKPCAVGYSIDSVQGLVYALPGTIHRAVRKSSLSSLYMWRRTRRAHVASQPSSGHSRVHTDHHISYTWHVMHCRGCNYTQPSLPSP